MIITKSNVQKAVFRMGLSPKHKGFYYISALLYKLAANRTLDVREECSLREAQPEQLQADRCMRYAIRYAWDVNEGDIHALFPNAKFPPTPCELLIVMLWELEE